MTKERDRKIGMGCGILFALPFALAGLFMSTQLIALLWQGWQAQSWDEVPAKILAAKLETHRDDDSDTYEATARYAYAYAGKRYESDNVSIHSGSDNHGKFHQQLDRQLQRHLKDQRPYSCFVNPNQPDEAVLNRDWRWSFLAFKAIFSLMFTGAGLGLMFGAWYTVRNDRRKQKLIDQSPDEPWLVRSDWAAGRIRSSRSRSFISSWIITLFWNLISWTTMLSFLASGEDIPLWALAFVWLFPTIGAFLLLGSIALTARILRWRRSEFELARVPGVIGGRLTGVVHTPAMRLPDTGFLFTLTCLRKRRDTDTEGTKTYYAPIWQIDKQIVGTLKEYSGEGLAIPIDFYVPYGCSPTQLHDEVRWQLEVFAELPWLDFRVNFEVPVFKTADSSEAQPSTESELLTEYEVPVTLKSTLARCGGELVHETPESLELFFGSTRKRGTVIAIASFNIVWWVVSLGTLSSDAPLVIKIAFLLLAFLTACAAFWMWAERVTILGDRTGVTYRGGFLGLGQQRHFAIDDIHSIKARDSGSRTSTITQGTTVYQEILLRCHGKPRRKQKLLGHLRRRADAEQLAKAIREAVWGTSPH